ncbi:MAG: divergent PAP2 family protein [Aerococcus sp.]|nr:divergent PAP2 family protein [Aerococcus sp.]
MSGHLNYPLFVTLSAIFITQFVKYPLALMFHREQAHWRIVRATGGMPSSHSAAVTSLITALILQNGMNSPYVAVAACFGVIIMFDAMGVRRQSGEQGLLLRRLLVISRYQAKEHGDDELLTQLNAIDDERMVIDDYLGHRPIEVFGGVASGILVAFVVRWIFGLFAISIL